jgi:transcriptional regulator with XRE-family HTH domain
MDVVLQRIIVELNSQRKRQIDLTNHLNINYNSFGHWKSGRNKSYLKYLYQIADFLGVSVEYLKGETDDKGIKKAAPEGAELEDNLFSDADRRFFELLPTLSENDKEQILALIEAKLKGRK